MILTQFTQMVLSQLLYTAINKQCSPYASRRHSFLTLNTAVLKRPCDVYLASVTVVSQHMKSKDKAEYSTSLSESGIRIQGHR